MILAIQTQNYKLKHAHQVLTFDPSKPACSLVLFVLRHDFKYVRIRFLARVECSGNCLVQESMMA